MILGGVFAHIASVSWTNHLLMRLRVSSIDQSVTKVILQEMFEEYGKVTAVKVFRNLDGTTPTLAFVEMKRDREAMEALKALNGQVVGDLALKVELSTDTVRTNRQVPSPPIEEDDDDFINQLDGSPYADEEEEEEGKIKEVSLDEINTDEI